MIKKIAVIGGGVIGNSTAWHLAKLGHEIIHFDPMQDNIRNSSKKLSGTEASLGVLMGEIYTKFSGRGFRLRQISMEMWPEWISALKKYNNQLSIKRPLVKIANSKLEAQYMERLICKKNNLNLDFLPKDKSIKLLPQFELNNFGCIISKNDGRIDPIKLQECLKKAISKEKVMTINQKVIFIERQASIRARKWALKLSNGKVITSDIIVICAAIDTNKLLENLGYTIPMETVIGQAIKIKCKGVDKWPSVINYNKLNIIPEDKNKLIIGATLEQSILPSKLKLENLKKEIQSMTQFIKNIDLESQWYGIRAKPIGKPAPILEKPESGLIIATCHYRNGILLAPATANWVEKEIEKEF